MAQVVYPDPRHAFGAGRTLDFPLLMGSDRQPYGVMTEHGPLFRSSVKEVWQALAWIYRDRKIPVRLVGPKRLHPGPYGPLRNPESESGDDWQRAARPHRRGEFLAWRMTRFDRIGAYGHTYHATPLAAVTDVLDYFGDIEIVERANPRPLREGDNRRGWPYAMQRETAEWRLAKARGKRAALQGITEHEKVRGLELESVSDPRVVFIITPGVRGDASWAGVEYPWQVSRFFRFAEGLQPIGHENARTLAEAVAKAVADSGGELRRTAMANPRKRPAVHAAGRGQRAGVQTVLCGARPGPSGLLAAYDIGEVTCGSCRRALRGGR